MILQISKQIKRASSISEHSTEHSRPHELSINKDRLDNIMTELCNASSTTVDFFEPIKEYSTLDIESSLSKDSPLIIKGFSAILMGAISIGATDIHIEPYETYIRIRYRVDGELIEAKSLSKNILNSLISRIKILSNLDIAERRLPQDGRMKMKISGKDIDFRIAIMPTIYGEKAAIRILDKSAVDMQIDKIGFTEEEYNKLLKSITASHGMILITGPTGSGKSTTLYSILNYLNTTNVNISTVEDPIEYNINGINQLQAKPEIGLTFASALRQFLRQDPDILMVGEIRDSETSEIAIKSALTGHLVLSTIHTNNAPGTIYRLINMGIEPFLISSALEMIISQRLIRKLCLSCRIEDESAEKKLKILGLNTERCNTNKFYTSNSSPCKECNYTGYKGRTAIHEVLAITNEIRSLIDNRATFQKLEELAKEQGMISIKEDGLIKAMIGITSLDEVIKTCH